MTDVATPPPATGRACPRCGAPLEADQEWCLNCGTAVGTRIAPTPRWRVPVAIVGSVLVLLAAALVLTLIELGHDPQPVAKAPSAAAPTATPSVAPDDGAATPAPTTAPEPTATPTPADGATPSVTPSEGNATPEGTPAAPGATGLTEWPSGKTAWTVIVASTKSRAEAEKKAKAAGIEAGVLHSDDFSSLRKGYWVVFEGQYPSQKAAQSAAEGRGNDAYARRVVPR
jgi:septal ring-binding cell division protein DamX